MNNKDKQRKPVFSVTAKDCRWDYYRGSGKGGQKRNKTSSAVRCTHLASKAVGQAEDGRSQFQNKKLAFRRMADTDIFRKWVKVQFSIKIGRQKEMEERIEREVERLMMPNNLRVEIQDENDKWKQIGLDDV